MNATTIRTFLGANSATGFTSLLAPFTEKDRTVVIKGGPGCGKSGLMKKIAAEATRQGYFTEYCYCSSDADSLDAVRIPEKSLCIVDGTAPHLCEPKFPGAKDEMINLGQFWDSQKLQGARSEIEAFSEQITACFARAYRYLSAAGSVTEDLSSQAKRYTDLERLRSFARNTARTKCRAKRGCATLLPRFLSAFAPQGSIVNRDTVYTLAQSVYVLDDPYHLSDVFLDTLLGSVAETEQTVYVCYDPLLPTRVKHVILPDCGVALVTSDSFHLFEPQRAYRIRLERFTQTNERIKESRRTANKLTNACIRLALEALREEKAYHDDLEEFYVEAMNFGKMNAYATKFVKKLFEA